MVLVRVDRVVAHLLVMVREVRHHSSKCSDHRNRLLSSR
jgi:hypothetical protein